MYNSSKISNLIIFIGSTINPDINDSAVFLRKAVFLTFMENNTEKKYIVSEEC